MKTNEADLVQHGGEIEYIFCRPKIKKICMHPKFLPKTIICNDTWNLGAMAKYFDLACFLHIMPKVNTFLPNFQIMSHSIVCLFLYSTNGSNFDTNDTLIKMCKQFTKLNTFD